MSEFKMENEYLSLKNLNIIKEKYNLDEKNVIIRHALNKTALSNIIYVQESEKDIDNKFSMSA